MISAVAGQIPHIMHWSCSLSSKSKISLFSLPIQWFVAPSSVKCGTCCEGTRTTRRDSDWNTKKKKWDWWFEQESNDLQLFVLPTMEVHVGNTTSVAIEKKIAERIIRVKVRKTFHPVPTVTLILAFWCAATWLLGITGMPWASWLPSIFQIFQEDSVLT